MTDDMELLERRRRLLAAREREPNERIEELDRREVFLDECDAAFQLREAEHEARVAAKEDDLDEREQELAALADRLARKETQVADYVAQVQKQLARPPAPAEQGSVSRRSWRRRTRADAQT